MINIQVADGNPEVIVEREIRKELTVFTFDQERYLGGLALAGVPKSAAESLAVDFISSSLGDYISYDDSEHRVEVDIVTRNNFKSNFHEDWPDVTRTRSSIVNFGLAKSANVIAEYTAEHPDVVAYKRNKVELTKPQSFGLGLSLFLGSVAGTAIAEGTGKEVLAGSILGGVAGLGGDVAVLSAFRYTRSNKAKIKSAREAKQRIKSRSLDFANSRKAQDIFNGIVEIQFKN